MRVDELNWPMDDTDSLRVAPQVRHEARFLLTSSIQLGWRQEWTGPWIDASGFNEVLFDIRRADVATGQFDIECFYETTWGEGHVYSASLGAGLNQDEKYIPTYRWDVLGPQIRLRCTNGEASPKGLDFVALLLRSQ